jgi:hypothetical protein
MRDPIEFVSCLPIRQRASLERLFFFNPRQRLLLDGIRGSLERFGRPGIIENDGKLSIGLAETETQCLFACVAGLRTSRLVGVVVYARTRPETLSVAHLAVDANYTHVGERGTEGLGFVLIEKVRQIGHCINGVRWIQLPYANDSFLPVDREKSPVRDIET